MSITDHDGGAGGYLPEMLPEDTGVAKAIAHQYGLWMRRLDADAWEDAASRFYSWIVQCEDAGLLDSSEWWGLFMFAANKRPRLLEFVDELFPYRPAAAKEYVQLRAIEGGKAEPKPEAPKGPSTARFRPFFAGEGNTQKPPMLIKGLLRERGVVLIGGQSQAGKSYAAIALALALATGGSFFGKPVKSAVGVIYAAAEGNDTIQPRLIAAQKAQNFPSHQQPPILVFQEFFLPRKGEGQKDALAPFIADVAAAKLAFAERGLPEPKVLFIDTASAGIDQEDENSNGSVSETIKRLRRLGDEIGMLIILVHHFGKDAGRKLRGGSAWFADSDQVLTVLSRVDDNGVPQNPRSLYLDKLRGVEAGLVGNFDLRSIHIGQDEDGDDEFEAHVVATAGGAVVTVNTMVKEKPKPEGKGPKAFRDAFAEALHRGVKRVIERGGPSVHMVHLALVREEFLKRFIGGKGAQRMAWKRVMDDINERGLGYAVEVDRRGDEWIWRADLQQGSMTAATLQDIPE